MTCQKLRDVRLMEYVLSDDEKGKRLALLKRVYLGLSLFFLLILATGPLVSFIRHHPYDYFEDLIFPATILLANLALYLNCPRKFAQPLIDSLTITEDGLKIKRDISERTIAFNKIADISTCTEGLWVEHGWTHTILEHKYFESYTDMLKFKEMLLEVARESRRKKGSTMGF